LKRSNAHAPLLSAIPRKSPGERKINPERIFIDAMDLGVEKNEDGPCGKNTKQLPNQKKF
jgi:hypothetical protein